jgi:hypothetical protein
MDLMQLGTVATPGDYYEPLDRATDESGRALCPTVVPDGWTDNRTGVWRSWTRPGLEVPDAGWKIHVSARFARAHHVLDTVAEVCFSAGVLFKHLASDISFLMVHHKHAPPAQAGKFCAVYPPDQQTARRLLDELSDRLRDEQGPYILTDRRYRDVTTVFYRYGAFRTVTRVLPDGTVENLVRDVSGELVRDERTVQFVLPAGMTDPFLDREPESAGEASADGVRIGDYRVIAPLAQSNAGGAYRALDPDGNPVFMKEAKAHNGLYWDWSTAQERLRREYRVLCELHEQAPGLAPRPIAHFREWEHEFLVTELVSGTSLHNVLASTNPYILCSTEVDYADYFATCRRWLDQLGGTLRRLHECGYRFGDINLQNILVTNDGDLRLVDFEACTRLDEPPVIMGVPGFAPPRWEEFDGHGADEYGYSAVALALLLPIHQFAQRYPAAVYHLRIDLDRQAAADVGPGKVRLPDDLWELATRNFTGSGRTPQAPKGQEDPRAPALPTPEEVAADPIRHLRGLYEGLRRDLVEAADRDDPHRIYPSVPRGYTANTHCVAFGTAGVLHALHHAGGPVDGQVVARLRREVRDGRTKLPPGLHFGMAGIGWVLAELGHLDDAVELVAAASGHPLTTRNATWGGGAAGVGGARLALYGFTGEQRHVDDAARLADALCLVDDLTPLVGMNDARGLLHGRAGVALFLYHLWRITGNKRYLRHGTGILHAELDRATEMRGGTLGFADDARARRVMTYLGTGAAGVGHVMTRFVHAGGDERLTEALPRIFAYATRWLSVEPGLYHGLAGNAFAQADHADLAGAPMPGAAALAVDLARGLFKQVTPAAGGRIRVLGEGAARFSTELWSGSAGVLLALDRILHGRSGQFFTLDDLLSDGVPGGGNRRPSNGQRRQRTPKGGEFT